MPEKTLSTREAAERLKMTPRAVRRACAEGRMPGAEMVGRDWRIKESGVAAFVPHKRGRKPKGEAR